MVNERGEAIDILDKHEKPVKAVITNVTTESGVLKDLTAIKYDENGFRVLKNGKVYSPNGSVVLVSVEAEACGEELRAGIIYDYFFLYMEPLVGKCELVLICTELDIKSGERKTYTYKKIELLELKSNPAIKSAEEGTHEYAKKRMLEVYKELMTNLEDIL